MLVQSFTFCASANPVVYLGGTPVFVDSERDSWNMDPGVLEDAIQDRIARTGKVPKAIIPVSLYGMPYQADRILAVADRWGIPVVEDTAEGLGSRFDGRQVGTFGRFGVFSFNGNKMITTSVGGALVCSSPEEKTEVMWRATQAREAYPYYQHEAIGYNYRMSNICAGIGLGQMAALDTHLAHHRHVNQLYRELLADVEGIQVHENPSPRYDSNFWLTTITVDKSLRVKDQEKVSDTVVTSFPVESTNVMRPGIMPHTAFEPADNVEALRRALDQADIEARPLWKPLHLQPVFKESPAYVNGVSESLFKVGLCLPSGPCVTEEDVHYIVDTIKSSLAGTDKGRVRMEQAVDERWFVAKTRFFRQEIKVRDYLAGRGVKTFVPTAVSTVRNGGTGKKRQYEKPLAPNLVFLRATKKAACSFITELQLPMQYMVDCATHRMLEVPDKQMSDFQRVFDFSTDRGGLMEVPLELGDTVKVVKGPLKGVEGSVMEILGKTYVAVGLLGSLWAKAQVPKAWLERI